MNTNINLIVNIPKDIIKPRKIGANNHLLEKTKFSIKSSIFSRKHSEIRIPPLIS